MCTQRVRRKDILFVNVRWYTSKPFLYLFSFLFAHLLHFVCLFCSTFISSLLITFILQYQKASTICEVPSERCDDIFVVYTPLPSPPLSSPLLSSPPLPSPPSSIYFILLHEDTLTKAARSCSTHSFNRFRCLIIKK